MTEISASYGPAMRACNERQRLFVLNLLEHGDDNFTRAARIAGYSEERPGIRVTAHRLAHDPKIQAAYHEESKKRLHSGLILATSTLVNHIKSADAKVSLKAVEMLLNRSGLHAMSEHKVQVEHSMNEDEMVKSIEMMAQKLGVDPSTLLGDAGVKKLEAPRQAPMNVIDAEFEEVMPSLEGLEGLEDCI